MNPRYTVQRGYCSKNDATPAVILHDQRTGKLTAVPTDQAPALADQIVDMVEAIESEAAPHGYPEATPVHLMTAREQVAYWKHQARRHEDRTKRILHKLEGLKL